ncbi:hypothetical protein D3C84_1103010 [compost metagenome]
MHKIKGAVELINAQPLLAHCIAFGEAHDRGAEGSELAQRAEAVWRSLGNLQGELEQHLLD